MLKICFRSRRYQVILIILVIISLIYFLSLHQSREEGLDLDITRSPNKTVADFVSSTTTSNNNYKSKYIKENLTKFDRDSIFEYIERRIQEELKEEKGAGCQLPKLDPFAKEVLEFDKPVPKIVCQGQDWVRCYLSKCRVQPQILKTFSNIKCTYKDIVYEHDFKYKLGLPKDVVGDGVYTLTRSDHVKISCSGLEGSSTIPTKWTGHAAGFRSGSEPDTYKPHPYNILILGFDSTSKNGFIRRMPLSYKTLIEELDAVVLDGYNILGDGTPAALFPILTGKTELQLPDVRKKKKNNATLDDMPFIFYRLKKEGYRTAYFEDMPWIGTFQYRFVGFKKQPADHYLRSFYMEESAQGQSWWKGKKDNKYCVGDTPRYSLMLNLTEQFFKLDRNKFCFTFIADITHDDINLISTADEDFQQFLQNFKKDGHLDNTLLFVMGDHGPRFANVRDTLQGKLEERLPLMALVFPKQLRRKSTILNSRVLTTPRDIHATVLEVLGWEYGSNYKVPGADLPVGLSLLDPIPRNRSCSEAGIEPHWCACLNWNNVSTTDPMHQRVASELVKFINTITEGQRLVCEPRTLTSIEWVMRQKAKPELLKFAAARDADGYVGAFTANTKLYKESYQAKIVVGPGRGVYEASLHYHIKEDKFEFSQRDISRTNAYGNEPSCISDLYPHLNMYCYCKD